MVELHALMWISDSTGTVRYRAPCRYKGTGTGMDLLVPALQRQHRHVQMYVNALLAQQASAPAALCPWKGRQLEFALGVISVSIDMSYWAISTGVNVSLMSE
jgi:hypothetical protein